MKRLLCLALILSVLLSAVSCSTLEVVEESVSDAETTENQTPQPEEDFVYPEIKNPLTRDKIRAIPVATADMTEDQLRQICVDFMRLQLSFEWTPDRDLSYKIETEMHNNKPMTFKKGTVYAGVPYRAGSNVGQSGLYAFMERYDPKTGVLSSVGLTTDQLTALISNHCSSSCYWAWSRVVNTMFGASDDTARSGFSNAKMTKGRGFLPVGPYTYGIVNDWTEGDGTRAVCEANGEQVMYRSYAAVRPADGLIQLYPKGMTQANHVQMIAKDPEIAYLPDGSIDGENSFLTILEQTSTLTETKREDGVTVWVEGGIDKRVSFKNMFRSSYLPFTFAEFQGKDPVDALNLQVIRKKGGEIETLAELRDSKIEANYPISSVNVIATDADGKSVYTRNAHPPRNGTFSYELYLAISQTPLSHEKKGNRVTVSVQLGNGEEVTIYQTK